MAANVTIDRFGNEYTLVGLKDKRSTGYGKGYIEIKGQLYKLEHSPANKEGYTGWVKVTKLKKQAKPTNW